MLNRFEDAIKVYLKALEINDDSPECHFNLASAYNDVGSIQKSAFHYQKAIELDEGNIDAYVCLGGALENLKMFENAEKAYKKALE